jgi:hypothetical protein
MTKESWSGKGALMLKKNMLNTAFSPWPSFTTEEAAAVQQVLLSNKAAQVLSAASLRGAV